VTLAALCLIGCTLQLLLLPPWAERRTNP
jgi:hypothetical protein